MRGGPSIRHVDDIPEQEVARFRLADGTITSLWEKYLEMSPRYFAFWSRFEPGAMTSYHGHRGDHVNFILQGELRGPDATCRAGTHILLENGDMFGPWTAGPDGCELYGFTAAEGGSGGQSYPRDAARWERFLAEIGAEQLVVPRPEGLPPWWAFEGSRTTRWD
jgi:hypothetical protein